MNMHLPLMTCDDETTPATAKAGMFPLQETTSLFLVEALPDKELLNALVFRVAKKPKCLLTHVQRIYYCYQAQLSEQLYAALVDFLIVLNKRGGAISRRMVQGAKAILNPAQFAYLQGYLHDAKIDHQLLPGNRYSIFSKGFIGVNRLMTAVETQQPVDYDPLVLARDFIEFSQLEEAQAVLEAAILEQPGRQELHEELLALYQSTRNISGFNQMLNELTHSGIDMPDAWLHKNAYFKELNQNG